MLKYKFSYEGHTHDVWLSLIDAVLEGHLKAILDFEHAKAVENRLVSFPIGDIGRILHIQEKLDKRYSKQSPVLPADIDKLEKEIEIEDLKRTIGMFKELLSFTYLSFD